MASSRVFADLVSVFLSDTFASTDHPLYHLIFSSTRSNDKNSTIGLRCSRDHVFDEISVSGCIDDGYIVPLCLKLHELNIDGDTPFTFSLKLVQYPGILEGTFTQFISFLLEFLNYSLVDSSTFVDHMPCTG